MTAPATPAPWTIRESAGHLGIGSLYFVEHRPAKGAVIRVAAFRRREDAEAVVEARNAQP